MLKNILRILSVSLGAVAGYYVSSLFAFSQEVLFRAQGSEVFYLTFKSLGALIGGVGGFFIIPHIIFSTYKMLAGLEDKIQKIPFQDIIAGSLGLIVGLIIAIIIVFAFPLSSLSAFGTIFQFVINFLLGYLGIIIFVKKKDDLLGFFTRFQSSTKRVSENGVHVSPKILDTSVIIDGRIADISETFFLEGTLIIPEFVLDELRHIADSPDLLKRNRGRRGLDILKKIQKDKRIPVEIVEQDFEDIEEVDSKLVRLAQTFSARIITNDYNLNKVAELQGIHVLNINDLANAVKPVVLPGEEMKVKVIKEGKEKGQGVAYLDDGTMIVVDEGEKHIGDEIRVLVTSILQTAAGRMIFAKVKVAEHVH